MTVSVGNAHLDVWSEIQAGASEEAKVAALIANQQRLRDDLKLLRTNLEKTSRGHNDALASEKEARAAADAKLDTQLRDAQIGGLHITILGIVWLLLGIVLSSLPSEIAAFRY